MPKPNFFIVGMPRAGTTSLHTYLSQHPQILMSSFKEPHFFGQDLTRGSLFNRLSEAEYLHFFDSAGKEKIFGESSTHYINSQQAAAEIHAFNPNAKILISLRNPVDQCYSYYSRHYAMGQDVVKHFEEAIDENRDLSLLPPQWMISGHFYKKNIRNLPGNIKRYQEIFGKENVKIIFFDDLEREPEKTYRGVIEFLGVDSGFTPEFKVYNAHVMSRSDMFHSLLVKANAFKDAFKVTHPRVFTKDTMQGRVKIAIRMVLNTITNRIINKKAVRTELSPQTRSKLTKEFLPVVEQLETIVGCDLSHWKI